MPATFSRHVYSAWRAVRVDLNPLYKTTTAHGNSSTLYETTTVPINSFTPYKPITVNTGTVSAKKVPVNSAAAIDSWNKSKFPNPQLDVDDCGSNGRKSWVCDPARLLTRQEGFLFTCAVISYNLVKFSCNLLTTYKTNN